MSVEPSTLRKLSQEELDKLPNETSLSVERARLVIEEGPEYQIGAMARLIDQHHKNLANLQKIHDDAKNGGTKIKAITAMTVSEKALFDCIKEMSKMTTAYREKSSNDKQPRARSAAPGQQVGVAVSVHLNQPSAAAEAKPAIATLITDRQ